MDKIKIFSSHRIDKNSINIKNNLIIPVKCGAVFDNKKSSIIGDNTGNNISKKRNAYCEFTVQYWAWKNQLAEYYGLCHYRRFLVFNDGLFKKNRLGMIECDFLDDKNIKHYNLDNEKIMCDNITKYDIIVNEAVCVEQIPTPNGRVYSVYEHWKAFHRIFFDKDILEILLDIIKNNFHNYYSSAMEYLNGKLHRGYNCYIMKKELFNKMCIFQFGVMQNIENIIKYNKKYEGYPRAIAYMGEILYGIYVYHISKCKKYKICEKPLVFFNYTEPILNKREYYIKKIMFKLKNMERLQYMLLPKGGCTRNIVKKIYYYIIK